MNNVSCPDCNSNNIQKIEKKHTKTIEKNGCGHVLVGFLFFPLTFLIKKNEKTEVHTYAYYACRSCGREFHN
jgi:DNA-directed RNA polymerase subunit RPC12/RpoP